MQALITVHRSTTSFGPLALALTDCVKSSIRFIHTLIDEYPTELSSPLPPVIQRFFHRAIPDVFTRNALHISYGYGYEDHAWMHHNYSIVASPVIVNLYVYQAQDTFRGTFKNAILRSLVSYLNQKDEPTSTWICKALKNEKFDEAEFLAQSVDVQQLARMIAKIYHRETFWWQTDKCLKPLTNRFLQYTIPDAFSQNVMAYVGKPHVTAQVCRAWAYFTRTMPNRQLLDFFNKEDNCNYIRQMIQRQLDKLYHSPLTGYQPERIMHAFMEKTDKYDSNDIRTYINELNYSESRNLLEVIRTLTLKTTTWQVYTAYDNFML